MGGQDGRKDTASYPASIHLNFFFSSRVNKRESSLFCLTHAHTQARTHTHAHRGVHFSSFSLTKVRQRHTLVKKDEEALNELEG